MLKVEMTPNGKKTYDIFLKDYGRAIEDRVIRHAPKIPEHEVARITRKFKREFYYVQDYLREIIEEENIEYAPGEPDEDKKVYRWNITFTRDSIEIQLAWAWTNPADPTRVEVLEHYLGEFFDTENYAKDRHDLGALMHWADDLDYKNTQEAIKMWVALWNNHDEIAQLFTDSELEEIRYAFQDGRRS
jgi:hypothetical protein